MKKLRWKKIKYKTLLLKETTAMWSTYFFKDNKKHKKSFEVWDFKVPSRYIRTLLSLGWNIRNFLRVSFLHFWSSENYSWNRRSFLKYKEFFGVPFSWKIRKAFFWENIGSFFGVSISWSIRSFLGVHCFHFLSSVWNVRDFI